MAIAARLSLGASRVKALYSVIAALKQSHVVINRYTATSVGIYKRLLSIALDWKSALCYYRAAKRDQRAGFVFTAAMELRKAAELFHLIPIARRSCWREWERIMQLPLRVAAPIMESEERVFPFAASNRGTIRTIATNQAILHRAM